MGCEAGTWKVTTRNHRRLQGGEEVKGASLHQRETSPYPCDIPSRNTPENSAFGQFLWRERGYFLPIFEINPLNTWLTEK